MKKLFFILSLLWAQGSFAEGALPKNSIYHLKGVWHNQDGQARTLKDYAGSLVIVGLVYTSCPHACPLTITKIQEIERKVLAKKKDLKFRVVLGSFDTVKDRPLQLKDYMQKRKLDESVWTLMSANQDSVVRELAIVLGINYKDLGDGDFTHSNVITLVDEQGVIVEHIDSLTADPEPLIKKMIQYGK